MQNLGAMSDPKEAFAAHAAVLAELAGAQLSEADTRGHLIDPVLSLLGYSALAELRREIPVKETREFLDYQLFVAGKAVAIVEAKSLQTSTIDAAAAQCVQYASILGVRWCVITNGRTWAIYDAYSTGPLAEKRVAFVEIRNDPKSVDDAWAVLSLLSRDAFAQSNGPATLILDRFVRQELLRPDSSAIRAIRASAKDRIGVTATGMEIIQAIERLSQQSRLTPTVTSEPPPSAKVAVIELPAVAEAAIDPPQADAQSDEETANRRVRLTRLIRSGLLTPGEQLEGQVDGLAVRALLLKSGQLECDGRPYANIEDAAESFGIKLSRRGAWAFWKRTGGESLWDVRTRFVSTEG